MDWHSFDALARTIAIGQPRRRVVGAIAVGLTAALVGRRPDIAVAGCKKVGRKCDKNKDCCKGARCKNGKCRCKDGWKDCEGNGRECVNRDKDERHCGHCDNACDTDHGEKCKDGVCVPHICAAGEDYCVADHEECNSTPGCRCLTRRADGATVCAVFHCEHTCSSDADCVEFGSDRFCVSNAGGECCGGSGQDFCAEPCPA